MANPILVTGAAGRVGAVGRTVTALLLKQGKAWKRLYLFGLLYFIAPVLALFLIFLPMSGAGYFGLQQGGPMFAVYLLLVNLPFGIVTALAARVIIGQKP